MTSDPSASAPASSGSLDPEALLIVRSCADRLVQGADEFVRRLHQDMVAQSPGLAGALAGQGWPFCERTSRGVLWVALTDQPEAIGAALRQIGAANWNDGFPDAEYVSVARALIRAVRALMDADWLTSMGSAWISYFLWMQPFLLAGARQAAADAEPVPGAAPPREGGQPTAADAEPVPGAAPPREGGQPAAATAARPADDDDEVGYGQLMVSMTLLSRRDRPGR